MQLDRMPHLVWLIITSSTRSPLAIGNVGASLVQMTTRRACGERPCHALRDARRVGGIHPTRAGRAAANPASVGSGARLARPPVLPQAQSLGSMVNAILAAENDLDPDAQQDEGR